MKHIVKAIAAAMILLLTGCASVPMAPMEQDMKAKEFLPAPNKASLYIYRSESMGAAIPMTVSVNGRALGQTAAQTYFRLNVTRGKYNVESHAENVSSLPVNVEAGRNYFVWQEVKMGLWMPRSQLQEVDENTGRAGVAESKLIASSFSDSDLVPLDAPMQAPSMSPSPTSSPTGQKLRELQNLRKDGVIREDEFQKKKKQLLDEL